jgi:molybdate-binding protein
LVEQLVQRLATEIADGRRAAGSALPSVRSLAVEADCAPGTVSRAYGELRSAGLIATRDRARARVAEDGALRARSWLRGSRTLRLAGSDDPALDVLLRAAGDSVELVAGPRGSVLGLEAVVRGRADAAAIHLLHEDSGRYNDPYVRRLLPEQPMLLVHLWRRELGLVVPRGNPLGIAGVGDLGGRRVAWRSRGSASRLQFERLLDDAGVVPSADRGETVDSHLAVAAMVAAGAADAGLAVRAVARACDLDFLPITLEPFELAVRQDAMPAADALLLRLKEHDVAKKIGALTGYDLADAGKRRSPA